MWGFGKFVFNLREKLSFKRGLMAEDVEKPFLDHLEDLRVMLTRMLMTIIISMMLCFIFKDFLISAIRRPIDAAHIERPEPEGTPKGLQAEEWPKVLATAHGLLSMRGEAEREAFLKHACGPDGKLRPYVDSVLIYHAALNLGEPERAAFLTEATSTRPQLREIIDDYQSKKLDVAYERGLAKMQMRFFSPAEGFNLSMKLALYAGVALSFPLLLYFLLVFVVPGLKAEEKKVLWPSLAVGFGLFLLGWTFAYYVVTPNALRFFFSYDKGMGAVSEYRYSDYVSFVVWFTLIFGLCFELPVIVYALIRLGLLSYEKMKNTRSYAAMIIIVVAAIVTPTSDPLNLSLLAGPMLLLYEMCIWLAYFHDRRQKKIEAAEEEERRARYAKTMASVAKEPAAESVNPYEPLPEMAGGGHGVVDHGETVITDLEPDSVVRDTMEDVDPPPKVQRRTDLVSHYEAEAMAHYRHMNDAPAETTRAEEKDNDELARPIEGNVDKKIADA